MSATQFPSNPAPSGRTYTPGDYASARHRAQSGAEVRILYGNKRLSSTLQLVYNNITDAEAEAFLTHYNLVKGTFESFKTSGNPTEAGWTGSAGELNTTAMVPGTQWRYSGPPQLQSAYVGRSSIVIDLVAVTV